MTEHSNRKKWRSGIVLLGILSLPTQLMAGSIDSLAPPTDASSAMFTLDDLYNQAASGTVASKRSGGFTEPSSGPGSSRRTVDEIQGVLPAPDNTDGATSAEVTTGKTFWGLRTDGTWGPQTGSMPSVGSQNITPGTTAQSINQGYHDGNGTVAGDADLVSGSILSGVDIFGVTGSLIEASGNATAANVLSGTTFSNSSGASTGTMASIGSQNITPGTTSQAISQGYHDGNGSVAGDADLTSGNILSGVDIFGVNGTAIQASGSATDPQVLSGISFSNSSGASTGTMANVGSQNITPGTTSQAISQGYHDGNGTVSGDADLTSGNILSGVDIFGVNGTAIEASGSATDSQVLSGITFSNSSGASTGSMANIGSQNITPGTTGQTISQGYHDGNGSVAGDTDLTSGNIKSGVDIFGVTGDSNVIDTASASAAAVEDIRAGKEAYVNGSLISGLMSTETLYATSSVGSAGYYEAMDLTAIDTDLAPGNIQSGVTIFGVTGTAYPAAVPKTGQTTSYATGDDGDLQTGVALPSPRFTDNNNGTVTDNQTGLIWLKDANCGGMRNWNLAVNLGNSLEDGDCGLTDNSVAGDWRLPQWKELKSLVDARYYNPSISNEAGNSQWSEGNIFTSVQAQTYWTSTTYAGNAAAAWNVGFYYGQDWYADKTQNYYVWPVRGGQ